MVFASILEHASSAFILASTTSRYIDDLFSVNNERLGHDIYLPVGTGAKGRNLNIQWSVLPGQENQDWWQQHTFPS